jgi:hypothetical protein
LPANLDEPSETGVVTKVARKYCTVQFPGGYPDTVEYDKETGHERSGSFMYVNRIQTAEQWAVDDRANAVDRALRKAGVVIDYGMHATTDQLEAIASILNIDVDQENKNADH